MRQIDLEKENFEFRPVKLRLKIDLVSYPARAEGLVNMISLKMNALMGPEFKPDTAISQPSILVIQVSLDNINNSI